MTKAPDLAHPSITNIAIRAASQATDISTEEILEKRRHPPIANARHLAMFLSRYPNHPIAARKVGNNPYLSSFPDIAKAFGKKDHTTVMHACEKISSVIDREEQSEFSKNVRAACDLFAEMYEAENLQYLKHIHPSISADTLEDALKEVAKIRERSTEVIATTALIASAQGEYETLEKIQSRNRTYTPRTIAASLMAENPGQTTPGMSGEDISWWLEVSAESVHETILHATALAEEDAVFSHEFISARERYITLYPTVKEELEDGWAMRDNISSIAAE